MSIVARTMRVIPDLSRRVASLVLCGSARSAPVYHLQLIPGLGLVARMIALCEILGAVSRSDGQKASLDGV